MVSTSQLPNLVGCSWREDQFGEHESFHFHGGHASHSPMPVKIGDFCLPHLQESCSPLSKISLAAKRCQRIELPPLKLPETSPSPFSADGLSEMSTGRHSEPCPRRSEGTSASGSSARSGPGSKRHLVAIHNARRMRQSAAKIESQWQELHGARRPSVEMRMIFAEARRRHQERQSFQRRLAQQEMEEAGEPTLWRLCQSKAILREAIHDIAASVKACSAMQKGAQEHPERTAPPATNWMKPCLPKLHALRILSRRLSDARNAESEWGQLASTIAD